ncbi:mitochondrial enolase superfamily member 1 [Grus japonensis]|uniref:Mitochondrial enolase superfamily member 1 n=1 Tax=Grus japonensis TaxID=30415 RepID=A0ABC9VS95_GRUJA
MRNGPEETGIQESCFIFRDYLHQAQERSILMSRKSSKGGRRATWMAKKLLTKLRHKQEAHRRWKQGQRDQEEYRYTVQVLRDGVGKTKDHLEVNLTRDMKNKMMCFYRYISSERKERENVPVAEWGRGHGGKRHRKD